MVDIEARLDRLESQNLRLVKLVNTGADLTLKQGQRIVEAEVRLLALEATVERLTGERRD